MGIRISHHIGRLTAGILLAAVAHAGEFAVLTNGFRIHADRHEIENGHIRLISGESVTEFAVADVAAFEDDGVVNRPAQVEVKAPPPQPPPPKDMFAAAAEMHGIPVALVRSVVKAESNFNPQAVSPKGAIGLMQLMPETARELGVDPANPEQNVEAGTRYLRDLLMKYDGQPDQVARALAAYNAGPGAVDKYKGIPPYAETQIYVRRVLLDYLKADSASKTPANP